MCRVISALFSSWRPMDYDELITNIQKIPLDRKGVAAFLRAAATDDQA